MTIDGQISINEHAGLPIYRVINVVAVKCFSLKYICASRNSVVAGPRLRVTGIENTQVQLLSCLHIFIDTIVCIEDSGTLRGYSVDNTDLAITTIAAASAAKETGTGTTTTAARLPPWFTATAKNKNRPPPSTTIASFERC
ncbi:hypothetical protein SAMN05216429_111114 [Marinobacter persicus]|uniref:Uncharacterized protein n=1 Tax=Marinobacter persicus TaxID=930118 RepID=A0A1I3XAT7_9GAMM|nr:hypothetical protein SAMN05216429_111114 [Marinobacter persicus]